MLAPSCRYPDILAEVSDGLAATLPCRRTFLHVYFYPGCLQSQSTASVAWMFFIRQRFAYGVNIDEVLVRVLVLGLVDSRGSAIMVQVLCDAKRGSLCC